MRDLVNDDRTLVCRIRGALCALPLTHVVETMRALPAEPIAGAPPFVSGVAIVRGVAVPVVDAARLLKGAGETPTFNTSAPRYVVVDAGRQLVALQVDDILGVRPVPSIARNALPRLLSRGDPDAIASMGALDAELLLVLQAAHLLPDGAMAGEGTS